MDRKTALQVIKVAGYHEDSKTFMRTYTENRISYSAAMKMYEVGYQQKKAGVKCDCSQCKNEKEAK